MRYMLRNITRRAALCLILLAAAPVTSLAQGVKERELRPAYDFTKIEIPVEIVSIKLNGRTMTPGQKIEAGDDWMRGVAFTLKNVSDKPISYVEVGLRFPHADDGRDFTTYLLSYGVEGTNHRNVAAPRPIRPGETLELVLSEDKYPFFQSMLARTNVSPGVETAAYYIDRIFFEGEPDLMWRGGRLLRRDANDINKFNVMERYTLPSNQAKQD